MDKTPVPGGYVEGYERARTDFSVKLRQANEKWEKLEREFYLKNDVLLAENRLLGEAVISLCNSEGYDYTVYFDDASLTAAEVERVRRLERVEEAAKGIRAMQRTGEDLDNPVKLYELYRELDAALSEEATNA